MMRPRMFSLALMIALSACGNFPQVTAATPQDIPARPPYLAADVVAALAVSATPAEDVIQSTEVAGADLRGKAAELRSR